MSGLFASRNSSGDAWFRLGRLEVGTVVLVMILVVASWLAWVAAPGLPGALAFSPQAVAAGELWRVFTWPLANGLSLWSVLTLFFFWYFGGELEASIGKVRMAWLLAGVWASLTVAATLAALALGGGLWLAGISLVEFVVLLVWIAEYPDRRFIFGIPAWVLGVVLVAVQALVMIASRDAGALLSLVLSLVLVAIAARRVGLLTGYPWIPGGPSSARKPAARAPRSGRARTPRRDRSDAERLDALLDQINERGIDSLSPGQRRELIRLRDRLRRS